MKLPIRDLFIGFTNRSIRKIKSKNLTFLSQSALSNISSCVKQVDSNNIEGVFVETGCALGGSTVLIGKSKKKERVLKVYDVFGMIPPPSDADGQDIHERYKDITDGNSTGIKNELYYGYEKDLLNKVVKTLNSFGLKQDEDNIELIQGLYEDTLKLDEPIAFAHIDCDWYDSVMVSLKQIEPNLSVGGIMIIDDYYAWSGCKTAIDEYFADKKFKSKFNFTEKYKKLIIRREEF